jgi:hypothetical protein
MKEKHNRSIINKFSIITIVSLNNVANTCFHLSESGELEVLPAYVFVIHFKAVPGDDQSQRSKYFHQRDMSANTFSTSSSPL